MNKRPNRNDTEEDLLQYQEEFFSKQQKPSVTVVQPKTKKTRDVVDLNSQDKPDEVKLNEPVRIRFDDDDFDASKRLDEKDKEDMVEILSNIKEKDLSNFPKSKINFFRNGFPQAPLLKSVKVVKTSGKKKSLFAQQFSSFNMRDDFGCENKDKDIVMYDVSKPSDSKNISSTDNDLNKSNCSKIQKTLNVDKSSIHKENMEKIKSMSESEIMEEQEKLITSLDPKLLSFLRSKKSGLNKSNISAIPESVKQTSNEEDEDTNKETGCFQSSVYPIKEEDKEKETYFNPYQQFGINKDLVHMDNVEYEKLSWMKDLPKVQKLKDASTPRFNFSGKLLSPAEDVPTNVGLHHHGDEPSLPGYTLEELFHMVRSNFPQQRIFALQTIARIIELYQDQEFSGLFTTDVLSQCLEAGLIFLLRWSLDEQSEQIYSASLYCLANILYIEKEQDMLSKIFFSYRGFEIPALCTFNKKSKEEMTQEELEDDRDLTDAEIINKDVIQGLLQIQLLHRIRFLMSIKETSNAACTNCLKILIRVGQHNSESAYAIFKCQYMINTIMEIFKTTEDIITKLHVIKLLIVLCLSGKNLTLSLISEHSIDEIVSSTYAATKDFNSSTNQLFSCCCQLWVVLVNYGFTVPLVKDFHALIMNQLQQISARYPQLNDLHAASTLLVLEGVIEGASVVTDVQYWSIIEGFYQVVYHCLTCVHRDMVKQRKVTHPMVTAMLIRCCSVYFSTKNSKIGSISPIDFLDNVTSFWEMLIQPTIKSPLFGDLLHELVMYSDFQEVEEEFKITKAPTNLPTHGLQQMSSLVSPSMKKDSPVLVTQSLLKLVLQLITINKCLVSKATIIVTTPGTLMYLKSILESANVIRSSIVLTTSSEMSIIQDLLHLYVAIGNTNNYCFPSTVNKLYVEVAFKMVSKFHLSQEDEVCEIVKNILFNPSLYKNLDYVLWTNPSSENESVNKRIKDLMVSCKRGLLQTGSMYERLFFTVKKTNVLAKTTFLIAPLKHSVLPSDWIFYPIIKFYNLSLKFGASGGTINKASDETILTIKYCLQYILLLQLTLPNALSEISETTRLTRLFCLYLTEGRIFAEDGIDDLLYALTVVYSSPTFQVYLNLEEKIPGVTSFYDIYCNLVEQYLASSFGDSTFANLLILPMQLRHDVKYRKAVWSDYCEILRIFPLPLQMITSDITTYFAASFEHIDMIHIYFQNLIAETIKHTWCPFFYLVALHHVNQFIFNCSGIKLDDNEDSHKALRKKYMLCIINSKNQELKDDVIFYQRLDMNEKKGFIKFALLPPSRELALRNANTSADVMCSYHLYATTHLLSHFGKKLPPFRLCDEKRKKQKHNHHL